MVFKISEILDYLSKSDNVNRELIEFIGFIKQLNQYKWAVHLYNNITEPEIDIIFCYECLFGKIGIINITMDNSFKKILKVCCIKECKLSKTITKNHITMDDIILFNNKGVEGKVWENFKLPTTDLEYAYNILLCCMKSIKITCNEMKKYKIGKIFDTEQVGEKI